METSTRRARLGETIQKNPIVWLTLFGVATVLLWRSPLLFPLRTFVVLVHETGHAVAGILTGAEIEHLIVRPDESGEVRYRGGWPIIITSAGYVGTAMLGSALLALTRWPHAHRAVVGLLGATLLLMTILYVPITNVFGFGLGLAWGALLLVMAVKRFPYLARVVDLLAVMLCLYAVYDFADFLLYDPSHTDAGILARYIGLPILAWPIGLGWTAVSLYLMYRGARVAIATDFDDSHGVPR